MTCISLETPSPLPMRRSCSCSSRRAASDAC
jgi:hypothetical protein